MTGVFLNRNIYKSAFKARCAFPAEKQEPSPSIRDIHRKYKDFLPESAKEKADPKARLFLFPSIR